MAAMTKPEAKVRMLTPRHQAVVATLAGMVVGVAVFGSVLAINGDAGSQAAADTANAPAVSTPPAAVGLPNPMQADRLRYERRSFGNDGDVSAEIPADWTLRELDNYKYRYVADPAGTWMIRFRPRSTKQSPRELAEDRQGSVRSAADFKLVELADGTRPVGWNPEDLEFTTLAFTSTRREAGETQPRMQLSRWVSVDGGKGSALEITVAGRPEDQAGLQGLIDHATDTLRLATEP